MQLRGRTFIVAALIAAAALVLHELRYLIGYGEHYGEALAVQGHGYLTLASNGVVVLLALGSAQLLLRVRRALRSATAAPQPPFGTLWLGAVCAVLAIYAGQELAEGFLSSGHPDGVAALASQGGWSAVPLSMALGAVVALLLRGAGAAEALAAAHGRRPALPSPRPLAFRLVASPRRPLDSPLACHRASRAPPVLLQAG